MNNQNKKPHTEVYQQVLEVYPQIQIAFKYYVNGFFCQNCGHKSDRWILKGVRIKEIQTQQCDNCGCDL